MKRNVTIWFLITSYMQYFWNVFPHEQKHCEFSCHFFHQILNHTMIVPVYSNSKIMFVEFRFTFQTFEWFFHHEQKQWNEISFIKFESPKWHFNIVFSTFVPFQIIVIIQYRFTLYTFEWFIKNSFFDVIKTFFL